VTRLQWQADEGESDMRGTQMVWPAIVLMSALSTAGAAQSAGGDGARLPQSPQYPLLPRALEIELARSAPPNERGPNDTPSGSRLSAGRCQPSSKRIAPTSAPSMKPSDDYTPSRQNCVTCSRSSRYARASSASAASAASTISPR
jgi:hypothetical protein